MALYPHTEVAQKWLCTPAQKWLRNGFVPPHINGSTITQDQLPHQLRQCARALGGSVMAVQLQLASTAIPHMHHTHTQSSQRKHNCTGSAPTSTPTGLLLGELVLCKHCQLHIKMSRWLWALEVPNYTTLIAGISSWRATL